MTNRFFAAPLSSALPGGPRAELGSDDMLTGNRMRRAGKRALGAIHDWAVGDRLKLGLGGVYNCDFAPSSAIDSYGSDPHGTMTSVPAIAD